MKRTLLAYALVLTVSVTTAQENYDTVKISSEKLAENIYMLKGYGGNIGVITGADGVVMIDDQYLPLGQKIKDAIATLDKGPIRFVINTHLHGDHSGGNEFFKQQGSTIIAHETVRVRMQKERVDRTTNTTRPPRDKNAWPVVTFNDKLNLHLNGQDIELIHSAPGHTDGDVIIYFKQANVFHMGDTFVTYGYPYIDVPSGGNINGLISGLDNAMKYMNDQSIIIPGHGNRSSKNDVKKYRDRLVEIRDQVAAALKKGKKMEDLAALGITDKYDSEWGGGFLKGKDFVMIVAEGIQSK